MTSGVNSPPAAGGRTLWQNLLSLASSDVLARVLFFLAAAFLTRHLSQAAFGRWSLAFSVSMFAVLIAHLGSEVIGVRELASRPDRGPRIFREILILKVVLGGLAAIGLMAASRVLPVAAETGLLIRVLGLLVLAQLLTVSWVYQGIERMGLVGGMTIVRSAAYLVGVLFLVPDDASLVRLPWIYSGAFLAAALIPWAFLPRSILLGPGRPTAGGVAALARQSLPVGLSFLMVMVLYHMGTVVLGMWRTEAEVGLYGAAFRTVWVFVGLSAAYHDALFPVISRLVSSPRELERVQSLSARLVFAVAVPLAAGGALVAEPLLGLLFGASYARAGVIFAVLLASASLILINNVYARVLLADRRMLVYLKIVVLQAACFTGLCLLLVPRHGAVGAAASVVAGEAVGFALYPFAAARVVRTPLLRFLPVPLAATAVMAGCVHLAGGLHVLLRIGIGLAVYSAAFLLLRGMRLSDLKELLLQVRGDAGRIGGS